VCCVLLGRGLCVVCCQVEGSAMSTPLVQRSLVDCGVSLWCVTDCGVSLTVVCH
jgi:hypothetical protein